MLTGRESYRRHSLADDSRYGGCAHRRCGLTVKCYGLNTLKIVDCIDKSGCLCIIIILARHIGAVERGCCRRKSSKIICIACCGVFALVENILRACNGVSQFG